MRRGILPAKKKPQFHLYFLPLWCLLFVPFEVPLRVCSIGIVFALALLASSSLFLPLSAQFRGLCGPSPLAQYQKHRFCSTFALLCFQSHLQLCLCAFVLADEPNDHGYRHTSILDAEDKCSSTGVRFVWMDFNGLFTSHWLCFHMVILP